MANSNGDGGAARRVVVTGLGVISSIGIGVDTFAAGLRAGRSGVRPISAFDTTGFAYANGCEVVDFDPREWIRNTPLEDIGRASQFAVAAAGMAVRDAGLSAEALRGRRSVVAVGTTDGESRDLDQLAQGHLERGVDGLDPVLVRRVDPGRLSSSVVRDLRLEDVETLTIPTACAASNYAVGYGFDAIRGGDVDVALCGGADAMCRRTFSGFYRVGTIAPEVCQPFDRDRKGIITGEGAGFLLLESLEAALARGGRIYAEVLGYGLTCDAYHSVAPHREGIARSMRLAHRDAGVTPEEVDFISAHGTGTKANDVTEAAAIQEVFDSSPPPTISIKAMIGHTMGAASALASAACALSISGEFIPPTINHVVTDPECAVDCVPNKARPATPRIVQNNALAFGGNNAVVILSRYPDGRRGGED